MPYHHVDCRIASTQTWVPEAQRTPLDEDAIRMWGVGSTSDPYIQFNYSDVPGNSWNDTKLAAAKDYIQANLLDYRVLRSALPDDHPYKFLDPKLNVWFWDGDYLVERHWLLVNLAHSNASGLGWLISEVRN